MTPMVSVESVVDGRYRRQAFDLTRGSLFTDLDLDLTLIPYFDHTR